MSEDNKFWETKLLSEMSHDEWESVCDGCAKCCLIQLQDEETEQLVFTDVACNLLNDTNCRCTDYQNRSTRVPSCLTMNQHNVEQAAQFSPPSCAYRLLVQGDGLPEWHHLVCGDKNAVHESGNSVRHRVRCEREVDERDLQNYVVDWP